MTSEIQWNDTDMDWMAVLEMLRPHILLTFMYLLAKTTWKNIICEAIKVEYFKFV